MAEYSVAKAKEDASKLIAEWREIYGRHEGTKGDSSKRRADAIAVLLAHVERLEQSMEAVGYQLHMGSSAFKVVRASLSDTITLPEPKPLEPKP